MIVLFSHIFILIEKYHVLSMYYDETIHNWLLWWLLSSVVCGILFKDINSCSVIWSPSMISAIRPHFHVPCPACVLFWLSRSGMATLFINVFTLFTTVNIAVVESSVGDAKVVFTHVVYQWLIAAGSRLTLIGAIHSWSINPQGPGRRLVYKQRQHAPLPAMPMPGAGRCEQYHTIVSQLENLDTVRAGEGSRAQSLI